MSNARTEDVLSPTPRACPKVLQHERARPKVLQHGACPRRDSSRIRVRRKRLGAPVRAQGSALVRAQGIAQTRKKRLIRKRAQGNAGACAKQRTTKYIERAQGDAGACARQRTMKCSGHKKKEQQRLGGLPRAAKKNSLWHLHHLGGLPLAASHSTPWLKANLEPKCQQCNLPLG